MKKIQFLKPKKKAKVKFSHSKWSNLSPDKHWHVALYTSVFLIVMSFAFGAYLFWQEYKAIQSINFDEGKVEIDNLNQEHIKKVLGMFEEREKKSIEIINGWPAYSDPSI